MPARSCGTAERRGGTARRTEDSRCQVVVTRRRRICTICKSNWLTEARSWIAVTSYFGMRKIEVRKDAEGINRLMLNNQPLFQYGPLDQGWWPDGLYTPPTDEAIQYDIEMTKKFGMNMARKHVKYECARWYYWCDRLGLLVWQDMPSGEAQRNAESKANYRRELKAMIDALHNFPSIVMWVPVQRRLGAARHGRRRAVDRGVRSDAAGQRSQRLDRSRAAARSRTCTAIPGPGMRPVEDKRVVVLGEFGGLGMPVPGHTWQAEKNWGYVSFKNAEELTDAYVDLLTAMRPLIGQGLSAAVYTQTTDVEIEVNGLMTYDREVNKIDVDRAAEAARKLYLPPPKVQTLVPTSEREPQTWKYTLETAGRELVPARLCRRQLGDRPGRIRHAGHSRSDGRHQVEHARISGCAARSRWTRCRPPGKSA